MEISTFPLWLQGKARKLDLYSAFHTHCALRDEKKIHLKQRNEDVWKPRAGRKEQMSSDFDILPKTNFDDGILTHGIQR